MRIWTAVIAGACALTISSAGQAGTAKELACIKVAPAVAQAIADKTFAAIASGEQPNLNDEVQLIVPSAAACKAQYGWTGSELEAAVTYAIALASRGGAEAGLKRNGVDPARAAKAFSGMPATIRAQFQQAPVPDSAIEQFMTAVAAQKIKLASDQQGQYLGMLAALMAVSEVNQTKFLAE